MQPTDTEILWLNLTNAGLGLATLAGIGVLAWVGRPRARASARRAASPPTPSTRTPPSSPSSASRWPTAARRSTRTRRRRRSRRSSPGAEEGRAVRCPFLREAHVQSCQASPFRKQIVRSGSAADERCGSAAWRDCSVGPRADRGAPERRLLPVPRGVARPVLLGRSRDEVHPLERPGLLPLRQRVPPLLRPLPRPRADLRSRGERRRGRAGVRRRRRHPRPDAGSGSRRATPGSPWRPTASATSASTPSSPGRSAGSTGSSS